MCGALHRWVPNGNTPGAKDLYLMAMHGISTLQVSRRTPSCLTLTVHAGSRQPSRQL